MVRMIKKISKRKVTKRPFVNDFGCFRAKGLLHRDIAKPGGAQLRQAGAGFPVCHDPVKRGLMDAFKE